MGKEKTVYDYYENPESTVGYELFLQGAQHFGYYPSGVGDISVLQAQKEHHDLLVRKLRVKEKDTVLDIGCGRGVVACDIARRFNISVTGIDIVPYILKEALKRAEMQGLGRKVMFQEMNYEKMEFADNTFDGVYAIETLSHASYLKNAIGEIYRVLKKGRCAVFFEYKIAHQRKFSEYENEMFELVRNGTAMHGLEGFRERRFEKLLEESSFKIAEALDISKNAGPSFERLNKYARIPYIFVKLLNLRKQFINTTAAVEYYTMAQKGLLRYYLYVVEK